MQIAAASYREEAKSWNDNIACSMQPAKSANRQIAALPLVYSERWRPSA